ncbi:hypothetical protein GWK47_003540 [Chionoecetes opilio]|uniref:Uncharacterized protein n=1 Tax=Chionoecetes opilio TaxID=41210 RepID=A0A8J5D2F7_CHIOP|nr:hypothetical protein GWK47_003540 [Chionoecetes opilio]
MLIHKEAGTQECKVPSYKMPLESGLHTCLGTQQGILTSLSSLGKYHFLASSITADIWVALRPVARNFLFLPHQCHLLVLWAKRSPQALPGSTASQGVDYCDTTSSFLERGKSRFGKAWGAYTEVTDAFNFIEYRTSTWHKSPWIARSPDAGTFHSVIYGQDSLLVVGE